MFEHGYALLIGVNENRRPALALPVAKNDVEALRDVLVDPQHCGYQNANVLVLSGKDATRVNIMEKLVWLQQKLAADGNENQTAMVYFSGHGHQDSTGSYLIPFDATAQLRQNGLAAAAFAAEVDKLTPLRLLVVLDCCYAAAMNVKGEVDTDLSPIAITHQAAGFSALVAGKARAVLSSSTGYQRSYVRSDGTMSVFTYHLIEALTGRAVRAEVPEVTVTEVMDYVAQKVPETAKALYNVDQVPSFHFDGTSYPVALVAGGKGIPTGQLPPDPKSIVPNIRSVVNVDRVTGLLVNMDFAGGVGSIPAGNLEAVTNVREVTGTAIGMRFGSTSRKDDSEDS